MTLTEGQIHEMGKMAAMNYLTQMIDEENERLMSDMRSELKECGKEAGKRMIKEGIEGVMEYYDPESEREYDDDGQTADNISSDDPMNEEFEDDPEFQGDFRDGFRRAGSVEDTYLQHFRDVNELRAFLEELGEAAGAEDEAQELINKIEEAEEYEKEVTGW